ncbi:MAG: RNA polymerase-associated protein RapA [Pseudomonadota bacterium]
MSAAPGQRFASATEPDLGLGMVIDVDGRRVTVLFPAAGERRVYALENAPLHRVQYTRGDRIEDDTGRTLRVTVAHERDGRLYYTCEDESGDTTELDEANISPFTQFTTPVQRLTSGQTDRLKTYRLRVQALELNASLMQSDVRGLRGPRVALLPHQLYIADTVARRHAPRVLLADEVGLGKTIEAGMIAHHQIETGRAQRVIVLVPDSLVYQWLVEMRRRFNLDFALYDAPRLDALMEEGIDSPFEAEQRIVCGLSLFTESIGTARSLLASPWDLAIVDEAHHLSWRNDTANDLLTPPVTAADEDDEPAVDEWSDQLTADERAYMVVEALAKCCDGLLLLTATPEQLGVASHFARLRLLDPARFESLVKFEQEQAGYKALNTHIDPLLDPDHELTDAQRAPLADALGRKISADPDAGERQMLLRDLLDRHGTGRVLFRNTRRAIPDFPERQVHPVALPQLTSPEASASVETALYGPPDGVPDWRTDSRVSWLVDFLKEDRTRKVLVICHRQAHARGLDEHLTLREGLRSSAFHEGMSLLERDRAAASFADIDGDGAQALICSEIGSEGRNFQFAQHLVMFDLPGHVDLLEQRIGRLDRIGQRATIHIHVPYARLSATHALFRWYQKGVDALARSVPGAAQIQNTFAAPLAAQLISANPVDTALDDLIESTAAETERVVADMSAGRDRLIELNSCDDQRAAALVETLQAEDEDRRLSRFLTAAFDHFGIDQEDDALRTVILRSNERSSAHLPGLTEDGLTATYDRAHALTREDLHFMTPEHPIAREALSLVVNGDIGNAAVCTMSLKGLPAGTLLLEAWFSVLVIAPRALGIDRYLAGTSRRVVIAANGKDVSGMLSSERLDGLCQDVDQRTASAVIREVRPALSSLVDHARRTAEETLPEQVSEARDALHASLGAERDRLSALAATNPNVRAEEIAHIEAILDNSDALLARAQSRLDALRLVVNT